MENGPSSFDAILSTYDASPLTFLEPSASLHTASLVEAKKNVDPIISDYSVFRQLALKDLDIEQVWEQLRMVIDRLLEDVHKSGYGGKGSNDISPKVKNGTKRSRGIDVIEDEDNPTEDESMFSTVEDDNLENESEENEDDVESEDLVPAMENAPDASSPQDVLESADEGVTDNDEENKASDVATDVLNGPKILPVRQDVHGLNDEFFSIDDFNRMTEQREARQEIDSDDEDDIDYFGDPDEQDSGAENANEITYQDFYLPPPNIRKPKALSIEHVPFSQTLEEDLLDDEARSSRFQRDLFEDTDRSPTPTEPNLSTYAKNKESMAKMIEKLERENIEDKEWMYKGESSTKHRPRNALLEVMEELDVERAPKPIPVITEEKTQSLEDIIRHRILDGLFDDVVRRLPPNSEKIGRPTLDDEMQNPGIKSTKSLAEIYEKDHMRGVDPANNPTEISKAMEKQFLSIDELWKTLSHQLDSLTSLRFIPEPVDTGKRPLANVPTIDMEDPRPEAEFGENTTSLAPQEMYKPKAKKREVILNGIAQNREEMSQVEKGRVRRRNKARKKIKVDDSTKGRERNEIIGSLQRGGVKIISKGTSGKALDMHRKGRR